MEQYTITKIEWESFPEDCPPHMTDAELPAAVYVGDFAGTPGSYREDAARAGILAHSPYCPYCTPHTPAGAEPGQGRREE